MASESRRIFYGKPKFRTRTGSPLRQSCHGHLGTTEGLPLSESDWGRVLYYNQLK